LISKSNRAHSQGPAGDVGRNELTGGNGCHPPVRNRLSYTYTASIAQARARVYLRAPAEVGVATSCQIWMFLVSRSMMLPTMKVRAAMTIG
jgi:hypothetical protein